MRELTKEEQQKWETPAWLFNALQSLYAGEEGFGVDVATDGKSNARVPDSFITEKENALRVDWADFLIPGTNWAFCNPPFRTMRLWTRKAEEQQAKFPLLGIVMVMNQCKDTKWYAHSKPSEVLEITGGRVAYINPVTKEPGKRPGKGSMVMVWRPTAQQAPGKRKLRELTLEELMAIGKAAEAMRTGE